MPCQLDHFMYAGADLDSLIATFQSLSGVKAVYGGTHPGLGTRNALASLGKDRYLELIAPDPAQNLAGTYGEPFPALAKPRIFAYVVKATNLERIHKTLRNAGIESDLLEASRVPPGGGTLRWGLVLPGLNPFGEYFPKFIDWKDATHPALTSVPGCTFDSFEIGHPESERLGELFRVLDVAISLVRADRPCFRARIKTPKGALVLTGAD